MSGHSKWNNIKAKKEKTDAQKAKIFTKMGREITVAVKEGGPNPEQNSKLKDVIAKAKSNNVPNDNIERIIKKASGDGNSDNYENIIYEGYAPAGVAVIIRALTDNRNRTAGDVRHIFDKHGGNMGQSGSVSFLFDLLGIIVIESNDIDAEKLMDDAVGAGAIDFIIEDEYFEVRTNPHDFSALSEALQNSGYKFLSAEISYVPKTTVKVDSEEDALKIEKMLDMFEDNDDIQSVDTNME